eukprot:TRINITY_DN2467_c0_g7_i1.p1 TRINITY_DN2467_c0_g7~~TRINITY_DN2467_c0_g7_i1.p1  ORF type:complete len:212 (+),score=40.97 TRINITY_DN2467_c0_g7_i1:34-669(+)
MSNIGEQPKPVSGSVVKYKVVFLGDQSVGKTSIIHRFMDDSFDGKDHPTVGIDFISKTMYFDDKTVRLQLWDTAGQERFRSLIPSYIRDSAVAVLVYDISNRQSFENVPKWIEFVREERGSDILIALLGNKADLAENRVVSTEEGEKRARETDTLFYEVSAKSGLNVQTLFKTIVTRLVSVASPTLPRPNQNIQLAMNNEQETKAKTGGCC